METSDSSSLRQFFREHSQHRDELPLRVASERKASALVQDALGKTRFLGPWWQRLARIAGMSARYSKYAAGVETKATAVIEAYLAALRKRADEGNDAAQYVLGSLYEDGQCGLSQDYSLAAAWYLNAAAQDHPGAALNLGTMLEKGQGIPQDYEQAAVWYRTAADSGVSAAQFSLGLLYAEGKGVPQDYVESSFWLELAASAPPKNIKLDALKAIKRVRSSVASHLTPAELSRVQERARSWFEDHAAKPQ